MWFTFKEVGLQASLAVVGDKVLQVEGLSFIIKIIGLILTFAIVFFNCGGPYHKSRVIFLLSPCCLVYKLYRAMMGCRSSQGLLLSFQRVAIPQFPWCDFHVAMQLFLKASLNFGCFQCWGREKQAQGKQRLNPTEQTSNSPLSFPPGSF